MSRDTQALLDGLKHLPAEEKRAFTDEDIGAASDNLWQSFDN